MCEIFSEIFIPTSTYEALETQIAINLKKHTQDWSTNICNTDAAFLDPTMRNEAHLEPRTAMVEYGFFIEAQRKVLEIPCMKRMHGNVDAEIKCIKMLWKHVVKTDIKK